MQLLLHVDWDSMDWGSVPDWLAGVGAVTALVFAYFAVRASHQTNIQQGKQLLALEDDRRRSQAAQVAAWITEVSGELICKVQNSSPLPVFAVHIYLRQLMRHPDVAENRAWIRVSPLVLPPGVTDIPIAGEVSSYDVWVELIDRRLALPVADQRTELRPSPRATRPAVTFEDTNGHAWYRDAHGVLHETNRPGLEGLYFARPDQPRWAFAKDVPFIDQTLAGRST
jgi:hypothetical protein